MVNYSEDYLKELFGTSFGSDKELAGIGLADLTKLTLKSVSGNIKYDTECLSLVSAETPNIKLGLTKQKSDALGGTILDGTLFDFTHADLAFFSNIMTKAEKAQFNNPKVLVKCTFRVISGSETPVYMRTKLTHLEVTTQKCGNLVKEKDIKLVHGRTTYFTYTNSSAVAGKTYYYKVKAICGKSSYGDSAFSAIRSITCDCARPVVSITTSNGHPKLSWSAVDGAAKYWVYRSTDGKNFSYYDSTTKTSYTNTSAKAGTTYYYKVIAVCGTSSYGNSAYSTVVSIKAK